MKMVNGAGEVVYYNCVTKHGEIRYQVQAASGQVLPGRDRQRRKSRTFSSQYNAERYLQRLGYETPSYK